MKVRTFLTLMLLIGILAVGCQNNPNPVHPDDTGLVVPLALSQVLLPVGATLDSAKFVIYVASPNDQIVDIYRVTESWDESTVTWTSFGGAYDPTVVASFLNNTAGWIEVDITPLVQSWLDGTNPNYGLLMDQPDKNYPRAEYVSKEGSSFFAPYVRVCYTITAVPSCELAADMGDTYIWEIEPNSNNGAKDLLYTGWASENDMEKQSLLMFDIEPTTSDGCTHTIGYWKNWNGLGPQEDMVTQYLPIWLGNNGGQCSIEVLTAEISEEILAMEWDSQKNGIIKLYAQLLGAKLSIADGASDADVADVISNADDFLADHCFDDWYDLEKSEQKMVLAWMETLDDYNNGVIGPAHCDDDEYEEEDDD